MPELSQTALANANAVRANNVQFSPSANVVPRKIIVIGTFDPAKTEVVPDVGVRVFSPEDGAAQFGFGSMIHRLLVGSFKGGKGIETFVIPQDEAGGAVKAAGTITFDSTGTKAGSVFLYIAGIPVTFNVAEADSSDDIATKCAAAINADQNLPITAVVDGGTTDQVNITAKMAGDFFGNEISFAFNLRVGEFFPVGVSQISVAMAGGVGTPNIGDALDSLGTDNDANKGFFTDGVHGYGSVTGVLDAISTYVGEGNLFDGLYDPLVARPFRFLTGDVGAGTAGLNALTVITDARLQDRSQGIIAAPGSQSHPSEIAAQAIGHMARINNNRAEESYTSIVLEDVFPGDDIDRWTKNYINGRDFAVKNGISPTKLEDGALVMQNVVTFYRPTNVPVESNGYRSQRNISIIQNFLTTVKVTFSQEKWKGISIVAQTDEVTNVASRAKARDIDSVIDELVGIADEFAANAWIFDAQFTKDSLKEPGAVTVLAGGVGFNNKMKIILSGEGGILNTEVQFDTSLDILTAA